MIGSAELIVILVAIACIFSLFGITLGIIKIGKKYPNKLWLGVLLSVIFSAFGQFYIPGGPKYFIILVVIFGLSNGVINIEWAYTLTGILSIILIWHRILKVRISTNVGINLKE